MTDLDDEIAEAERRDLAEYHRSNGDGHPTKRCTPSDPCGDCDDCADVGQDDLPDSPVDRMRAHLLSGRAVLDIPEPGWVIDKVVPAGALVIDYGPPKQGKSFIVLDQSMCVAKGIPWAATWDREWGGGYQTTQGTVVYVAGEGVGGLGRRVRAWLEHHQTDDPGDIHWLTRAVNLTDVSEVWAVIELVKPLRPTMIVFDTLARCSLGAEENSAKDMGQVIAGMDLVREHTGAAVRAVHHAGQDVSKGPRGSTALYGAADVVSLITRDGRAVTWKCTDMKDSECPRPVEFQMADVAGSIALTASETGETRVTPDSYWKVLDALKEIYIDDPLPTSKWMDSCGSEIARATFGRAQKWLVENGHVDRSGEKSARRYAVRQEGSTDAA